MPALAHEAGGLKGALHGTGSEGWGAGERAAIGERGAGVNVGSAPPIFQDRKYFTAGLRFKLDNDRLIPLACTRSTGGLPMKCVAYAASAAAVALCLAGCATVTRGTTTDFKVASTPSGASVTTSTGFSCSPTPCVIKKMIRKEAFDATITLAGYKPKTAHVQSLVEGGGAAGAVGNVLVGGVIGVAVDATSGAMDDLVPNPLSVTLEPVDTAAAQPATEAQPASAPPPPPAPTPSPTASQ
jgi:hypothetical protein